MPRMNYDPRETIDWSSRRKGLPEGCITYEPSLVDSFQTEEMISKRGKKIIRIASDVRFLLNQQRVSRELLPVIDDIVASARSSELSDRFSHLSDDDIIGCIKSRYIQAPSEVRNWSRYLLAEAERLDIPLDSVADDLPDNQSTDNQSTDNQSNTE